MAKELSYLAQAIPLAILGNGKWDKSMERDLRRILMVTHIQVAIKMMSTMEKELKLSSIVTVQHMRATSKMETLMALELKPTKVDVSGKASGSKIYFMIRMYSVLKQTVQARELITNMATLLSLMSEQKQTEGLYDFIF